jgi:hypothetical protein
LFKKFFPRATTISAATAVTKGLAGKASPYVVPASIWSGAASIYLSSASIYLSSASIYLGLASLYIGLATILIGMAPAALADQQNPAEIDGYSLYQTSAVLGDKDVLLSSNALKVVDRKNGTGVMAQAPDWKVYVLNPRSRRICSYTLTKYPGIGKEISSITGGILLGNLPLNRGPKSIVSGISAVSCETSKVFESKQQKDLERGFAGPHFVKWGQLLIADQGPLDKLPRQAKSILCRFYGLPEFAGQGLPLQFKYVDLADGLHTLLLTNSFKTTKLPSNTFDQPTGYTAVADMNKLDDRPKLKDIGPTKAIEVLKKNRYH